MAGFEPLDIMTLTAEHPPLDLAGSVAPALRLDDVLGDEHRGLRLDYAPPTGSDALREVIATEHDVSVDDVIVTAGGMHALFLLALQLCGPGGQAVTTRPVFPILHAALDAVGARIETMPTRFDHGYRLEIEDLIAHTTAETRLVYLATPQNPSGVAIPPEDIGEVAARLATTTPEAVLVVDETYRAATYGSTIPPTVAGTAPNIVVTSSVSKLHGAPGLRIGWAIATNPATRDRLLHAKYGTVLGCSAVDEAIATRVLATPSLIERQRQHLTAARDITEQWIATESLIDWVPPDGGGLCCIRIHNANTPSDWDQRLRDAGTRLAPGPWFGDDPNIYRLGFGALATDALASALQVLSHSVRTHPPSP